MNTQLEHYGDEISFTDILMKLWNRRCLLLILTVLGGLVGVLAVLVTATQTHTPVIHYVSLTAIEKGNYPNGVAFSPRDIEAPEVLAEVSRRMGLDNNEDLATAVNVSLGAPTTPGIFEKYDGRLAQKGLNAAEINAINAELDEELNQATQKTAVILVDYQSLGLDFEKGAQLATMLPIVWAEVFTTKFRVLDNTQLSGTSQIDKLSLLSASGALEANNYVIDMLRSLTILEEDSRLSALQTESGITPSDLRVRVDNFNNLFLSVILSRNLGSQDVLTTFYQNDLKLRIKQINENIDGIDSSISSIQNIISGNQNVGAVGQGFNAARMQVTGDAISDIVDLVNKSSLTEYLTDLYERKSKFINELNYMYVSLLVKAREMNRMNNAALSHALGSPFKSGSLLPKKSLLIIVLSVLMGGFAATVLALILPSRNQA